MSTLAGAASRATRPWDPVVRLTHWLVAMVVLLNGLVLEEGSDLHKWLGYGAAALLGLRLLWGHVGPAEARFSAFPPRPRAALHHLAGLLAGRDQPHASHNPLGALMVYALWLTLAVVAATGIAMADPPWLATGRDARMAEAAPAFDSLAQGSRATALDDAGDDRDDREGRGGMPGTFGMEAREADDDGRDDRGEKEEEVLEEVHESAANLLLLLAAGHIAGVTAQSFVSRGRELRRMLGLSGRGG